MIQLVLKLEPDASEFAKGLADDFDSEAGDLIGDLVRQIPVEMRFLMGASPATGRKYGKGRIASQEGSAPRNQTLSASKSFRGQMISRTEGEIEMNWYIDFLDRMRNRPIIEPAVDMSLTKVMGKL